MKKIAIGLTVVAIAAAIALLARDRFADGSALAAPTDTAETAELPDAPGTAAPDELVGSTDTTGPAAGEGTGSGVVESSEGVAGDMSESDAGTGTSGEIAPAPADPSDGADAAERADSTQDPAPETVLARAAEAYEGVRSMRADFSQVVENTLLGTTATSRGTIHQRRPDRFLMEFSEPAGDVIVGDGEHFWIYYPSIDEDQVIRTPMRAGGAGGVDLQAQFLGDPNERFDATLDGTESVDGRRARILTLEPTRALGYELLTVWVDVDDHLVRRFEIHEPNGVIRRIDLEELEINPTLDDSLFQFTPPEGASIIDQG